MNENTKLLLRILTNKKVNPYVADIFYCNKNEFLMSKGKKKKVDLHHCRLFMCSSFLNGIV